MSDPQPKHQDEENAQSKNRVDQGPQQGKEQYHRLEVPPKKACPDTKEANQGPMAGQPEESTALKEEAVAEEEAVALEPEEQQEMTEDEWKHQGRLPEEQEEQDLD